MAGGFGGGPRGYRAVPPDKGSFPLDHFAECQSFMKNYLKCLSKSSSIHHQCKELSRMYLQCRIDRGLMADEDLDELGYAHEVSFPSETANVDRSRERKGYVGGVTGNDKK